MNRVAGDGGLVGRLMVGRRNVDASASGGRMDNGDPFEG